ncbi:MAG TPA: hypothetical protein VF060_15830 [Trebonia sp.]
MGDAEGEGAGQDGTALAGDGLAVGAVGPVGDGLADGAAGPAGDGLADGAAGPVGDGLADGALGDGSVEDDALGVATPTAWLVATYKLTVAPATSTDPCAGVCSYTVPAGTGRPAGGLPATTCTANPVV